MLVSRQRVTAIRRVQGATGPKHQASHATRRTLLASTCIGPRQMARGYELALSTVTARRFCDQHEMSLHTATGRSLP